MSTKIYLSPSNQDANIYAAGNTNEMIQCNKIAEAAKKYLEKQNIFIEYSTPRYLVCILTLMDNGMVFDRLFTALKQYVSSGGKSSAGYVDMCFPNK